MNPNCLWVSLSSHFFLFLLASREIGPTSTSQDDHCSATADVFRLWRHYVAVCGTTIVPRITTLGHHKSTYLDQPIVTPSVARGGHCLVLLLLGTLSLEANPGFLHDS